MNPEDPNHGPALSPPVSPSQPAVTPPPSQSPPTPPSRPPLGMARPKPSVQPLEIPPRPISQLGSTSPLSQSTIFSPTPHHHPVPSPGRSQAESTIFSPTPHHHPVPSPGRSQAEAGPPSSPSPGRSQAEASPPSLPPSQPHTTARPKLYIQPLEIPPTPSYQTEVMSPIPQVAAMSPKPSPTSQQRLSISSTLHHHHHPSFAMSPTPHRHQPLMMGPPPFLPHYQPYMYPPPPYYHPGPTFNVAMAPVGGFQTPNHCYPEHERTWSTDLFDCTKDIKNCTRTICCPCVTFGQIAEIVNEGTTPWYEPGLLCALLAAFVPCMFIFHSSFPYTACYRTKLRKKYKLRGSVLEDCLVHSFCECCALCQEFRELDHQGFDVPLGWHENKRRERQAVAVFRFIPPEEQGMTR